MGKLSIILFYLMKSVKLGQQLSDDEAIIALEELQKQFSLKQDEIRATYEWAEYTKVEKENERKELEESNQEIKRIINKSIQNRREKEHEKVLDAKEAHEISRKTQILDDIKNKSTAKKKELLLLQDKIKELENIETKKPSHEANPMMRNIRQLENKLDKAMIKYNEAQSIKKT